MNKKQNLRVIDFFCGAGGFSEGFRQAGYEIIMGIDNWKPAITTHNINHSLNDSVRSVLDFENIDNILSLPDSEIIVGSPPCVSFSLSNKGGGGDKSLGIRLIEAYLRVVAVKKHQQGSTLKAWLMENVPNSRNYVKETYTFKDLNLSDWARNNDINPKDIALNVKNNGNILTASNYGSPQARRRFVCGEIVKSGEFPEPVELSSAPVLSDILTALPAPLSRSKKAIITDPNYPTLSIPAQSVTDHFYDTGVYEVEWRKARNAKQNHPYMGKMAFPENLHKPSRTIMATRSASTREALIYKSELKRSGNGEYRAPTIREAASIMGFPLTYVFYGNESTKWRQVGNAVCVQLSHALALKVQNCLGIKKVAVKFSSLNIREIGIDFLDNPQPRQFDNTPKKSLNALFRAHPVKTGNMTVALTNRSSKDDKTWATTAYVGTGKGYKSVEISNALHVCSQSIIKENIPAYIKLIEKDASMRKYSDTELTKMNSNYANISDSPHPLKIVDTVARYIRTALSDAEDIIVQTGKTSLREIKETMPLSQIMAIYTLGSLIELDE